MVGGETMKIQLLVCADMKAYGFGNLTGSLMMETLGFNDFMGQTGPIEIRDTMMIHGLLQLLTMKMIVFIMQYGRLSLLEAGNIILMLSLIHI